MFRSNNNAIASGLLLGLVLLFLAVLMHEPCVARDARTLPPGVSITRSQPLRMQAPVEIYASPEWHGNSPHSDVLRDTRRVLSQSFSIWLPAIFAPKVSSRVLNSVFNL